jgi:HK97 family phage prohead protease
MKKKTFQGAIEIKEDGKPGEFRAVFSTFNVIDKDRDVTLPGAFKEGQKVRIAYWGHRWQDLPVGRGEIHADEEKAWVDGRFFMDTEAGKETYLTVKNLDELQEWSYGYDILDASQGKFEDQNVQFLRSLEVYEVSPVLLGAGVDTRTEFIKEGPQGDPPEPTAPGEGEGTSSIGGNGNGAEGEPSGPGPEVVRTGIDILLLEV